MPRPQTPVHPAQWLPDRPRRAADRLPVPIAPAATVAAVVLAADWTSKAWIQHALADREVHPFAGPLHLTHAHNQSALGIDQAAAPFGGTVVGVAVLLLTLALTRRILERGRRLGPRWLPLAWWFAGLGAGGVFANTVERLARGSVTDLLVARTSEGWSYVYNVADLALYACVALALPLALAELAARRRRTPG